MRKGAGRFRLRSALVNAAVLTVTVSLIYLVGGQLALRYYFPYQSPTLRSHLPDLPVVVGQTSKRSTVPRDYIAILGDSYAEGLGDWLIQAEATGARRYHAGHVVHDMTGRDVISLGRWGYGSAEFMVLKPARLFLDRTCPALPALERPSKIVVYFYEGNDPIDNRRFVEMRVPAATTGNSPDLIDRYLTERYGTVAWWRCHTYFALTLRDWAKFAYRQIRIAAVAGPRAAVAAPAEPTGTELPNQLRFADKVLRAGTLLGPPLHFTEPQNLLAAMVFSRSLAWLRAQFPDIPVLVAYLPSPAVAYRFAGGTASVREGPAAVMRSTGVVQAASQSLCQRFRKLALEGGAQFLDARPALRAAAQVAPVHGPLDWDHFNEAGYRALGQALVPAIGGTESTPCHAPKDTQGMSSEPL
jgi:hypothetical protein